MPSHSDPTPAAGAEAVGRLRGLARRCPVTVFLVGAFGIAWASLAAALVTDLPVEPFLLVANIVGLLGSALTVTWLADGRPAVRRLLAGVLRWRIGWTWALLALLGIPVTTLLLAAATGTLVPPQDGWGWMAVDLGVGTLLWGALLFNLWEETAWAGFVQRRLMDRHGLLVGSALTALPFAALHLPLLLYGRSGVAEVVTGAGGLLLLAFVFRLLAGTVLLSTGGSTLAVGVLHAAFNSAGELDAVQGDWQRDVALIVCTVGGLFLWRAHRRRALSVDGLSRAAERDVPDQPSLQSGPPTRRDELLRFRAAHPVHGLTAGGTHWQYLTGGAGSHVVLYLPGGSGQAEASFEYLAAMETDHRVVSVTYPEVETIDDLVDGVLSVLDAECVDTATVWGTSFGGMVAQVLVRRAPHRVGALVLANTAAPSRRRARRIAEQMLVLRALPASLVRPLLRAALVARLRGLNPPEQAFWRAYLTETLLPRAKQATLALTRLGLDFHRRRFAATDLDGWPGRVLILQATDAELYQEMHQPMRRLYRGAEIRTFEGGHTTSLAQADQYIAAVRAFLHARAVPTRAGW